MNGDIAMIRARLQRLRTHGAVTLSFPERDIVGRVTYLAVNGVAHNLFGVGNYRLEKPRGSRQIHVTRLG